MYSEEKAVSNKRPDFAEVIDALKQENEKLQQNAERAFYFTNQFKDCRQPSPEVEEKQKEPSGLIEILQYEIRKMRKANDVLRMSNDGLQGIVGS